MNRLLGVLLVVSFLVGAGGALPAAAGSMPRDLRLIGEETGLVASERPLSPGCIFDEGYQVYLCPEPQAPAGQRDPAAAARARELLGSSGLLLIPDSTAKRVMAFDPVTGDLVDADFVPADPTNLSTPVNAILSPAGNTILVSDQVKDLVQEYDLDGNFLGTFAPAGGPDPNILDNIRGIALRPNGHLLVTVGSGANDDAVAEFDTDGAYLGLFVGKASGGLGSPFDVFGRSVDWLVAGIDSNMVHRYDLEGAYLADLAPVDSFPEQIHEAPGTNVLVANFSGTQEGVLEFLADGTPVGIYIAPGLGGYRGVYELPSGNILTTTGSGVYEIDRLGNLIETKITAVSGRFIEYLPPQMQNTLTCGSIGYAFLMDPYGREMIKWWVESIDQNGAPVPMVVVDADLTWPTGGPASRTRLTQADGFARFPWGANAAGTWTIDVTAMTLDGYAFVDGPSCSAAAVGK